LSNKKPTKSAASNLDIVFFHTLFPASVLNYDKTDAGFDPVWDWANVLNQVAFAPVFYLIVIKNIYSVNNIYKIRHFPTSLQLVCIQIIQKCTVIIHENFSTKMMPEQYFISRISKNRE